MDPFLLLLILWWPVFGQARNQPAVTSPVVPRPLANLTEIDGTELRIDPAAMQVNAAPNGTSQFYLIAMEIFSLYIPQSIRPGLGVAIQSAAASATITGNINSLVTSALLAETPPGFLTAVPSQYQTNIARVEAAVSSIRAGLSRISVSSAKQDTSVSIKALNGSIQSVNSSILVSTTDSRGSSIVTLLSATVVNGTKLAVTPTAETSSAGNNQTVPNSKETPSISSSVNVAFAVAPTQVSLAAAGIIGFVGVIAAL
ncbi:hypothetical protein MMC29_007058 [Sticta canariensis]|nr:hypothetical protein [Sticta canariensis]